LIDTASNDLRGEYRSTWVLLSASQSFFDQPEIAAVAETIPLIRSLKPWTDDYSSLLPILQLNRH